MKNLASFVRGMNPFVAYYVLQTIIIFAMIIILGLSGEIVNPGIASHFRAFYALLGFAMFLSLILSILFLIGWFLSIILLLVISFIAQILKLTKISDAIYSITTKQEEITKWFVGDNLGKIIY